MMRCLKPTPLTRLLVATSMLLGSAASGPTFGHAHPNGDTQHVHVDWDADHHHDDASRDHESAVVDAHHDHDADLAVAGRSEFHLHDVWFGIPVSLAMPAEPDSDQETHNPFASAYVLPTPMIHGCSARSLEGRAVCPDTLGLALDIGAGLQIPTNPRLTSPPLHEAGIPCALQSRSGVLRC